MKAKKKVPAKKAVKKAAGKTTKRITARPTERIKSSGVINLGGDQDAIYTVNNDKVVVEFTAPESVEYSTGNTRRITYDRAEFIQKYGARL